MTWNPKLGIGLEVPPAKETVHIPDLTIPPPPGTHGTIPVDPPGGFPHATIPVDPPLRHGPAGMGHGPVVRPVPESYCPRCVEDDDSRKSIDDENAEAHGFQTPK